MFGNMILLHTIISSVFLHTSVGVEEETFYFAVLCDLEARMQNNCSRLATDVKTMNICAFQCTKNSDCVGVSIDDQGRCFHHMPCPQVSECTTREITHKYKSKNCAHGGIWNPEASACSCESGWIGKNCLDIPSDCSDLSKHGYPSLRTYLLLETGQVDRAIPPTPVYCRIIKNWDCLPLFHNAGGVNFNRTWDEYKKGFFVDDNNFWTGLEHVHLLTKAGYTQLVNSFKSGGRRLYMNFQVQNESQKFSFTYDSTKEMPKKMSNADRTGFNDCLGPVKNTPFSTIDNPNSDAVDENCASKLGSGWWHNDEDCTGSKCNFLGKFPRDWDEIPEYQRVRVDKIGAELIKRYETELIMWFYLKRP